LFGDKDVWNLKKDELKKYWKEVHGIFQDIFASFNPIYKIDRMLFQAFNLFDKKVHNSIDKETIMEETLEMVGLRPKEVLGRYPHELSGGQLQRLMIARCCILKPKLIIADEPTSMIDTSTRASMINLLMELRRELKSSLIFILHDIGLAYYVSDRILIMHEGRIVEDGKPDEIFSKPRHPYTKQLLTDVPSLYRKWTD
jgi:peptide/nickel transport system ATP-binding protein